MDRKLLEELLARQDENSLLEILSGVDGSLDELFETGSITLDLLLESGPAKVVLSLQAEIDNSDQPADGPVGVNESGCGA